MNRLALSSILALVVAGGIAVPAGAQSVTVIVNGQTMSFDQPPIVQAGRVFVPLRGVFERLGASVVYADGLINATGRGRTVSLRIGSTQATVDGQPTTLDVAPFVVGARTLVPLRFVAQSLGASVDWNDGTSTVTIVGGRGARPIQPGQGPVALSYRWPTGTIYNHNPQVRFQMNRPVQRRRIQRLGRRPRRNSRRTQQRPVFLGGGTVVAADGEPPRSRERAHRRRRSLRPELGVLPGVLLADLTREKRGRRAAAALDSR